MTKLEIIEMIKEKNSKGALLIKVSCEGMIMKSHANNIFPLIEEVNEMNSDNFKLEAVYF